MGRKHFWWERSFDLFFMGLGALFYARYIEPHHPVVERLHLHLPRLGGAFQGFRLAHLSDLHVDTNGGLARLEKAVSLINAWQPDAVVITGDYITYDLQGYQRRMEQQLRRLQAPSGRFGILGNHDHWTDERGVRQLLQASGVIDLSNCVYSIEREGALLHFAGLDDHWVERDDLETVLAQLPSAGAAILLAHEPILAQASAATGRFDLQLSGHTHGGQISLPFTRRPSAANLTYLNGGYGAGLYQVGDMWQYTSRGLGVAPPGLRWNCPPEITFITLESGA